MKKTPIYVMLNLRALYRPDRIIHVPYRKWYLFLKRLEKEQALQAKVGTVIGIMIGIGMLIVLGL